MIADYHVHTNMCGHGTGALDELVEAAIAKGLDEVGIADHLPLFYTDDPCLAMAPEDLPVYVERVLDLKERYRRRITVRLGIEADYHAPTQEKRARLLEQYPWEYVIGSVHMLDDWLFDDPRQLARYEGLDIDQFYIDYLNAVGDMISTGLYNTVGHADLAKKFNVRASIDLEPRYRDLLMKIKNAGACYEINTAGLRWPVREMYPAPEFVKLAASLGVPVTLGSDAHNPQDIARDFDSALTLINDAGYKEMATFDRGVMRLAPLST
ncbi:MAG: histidinol-phosphatase [Candidatus Anoxymicrobium japonicum]|uniref:Histidinol-phosphatase n=1 Tax=Candidatus Anoxymicrobium japonicum TaxID=2013648 RepID=A0A2N3G645_9ACTN|nr:MAG: histidinol-phosphatase [Candidatus Anoxymicrobium japonicum]